MKKQLISGKLYRLYGQIVMFLSYEIKSNEINLYVIGEPNAISIIYDIKVLHEGQVKNIQLLSDPTEKFLELDSQQHV